MDLTGTHAARALTAVLSETKKGDPQVVVDFQLLDIEGQSPHIAWYGYFTDKTMDRTIETLRLCGWKGSDLNSLDGLGDNEVSIVLETEEYEGKARQKVQWVNRAGGLAMANPLSADQAKAFAAKMRGAVLAFDQKAGKPAANGKKDTSRPPF